MTSNHRPSPDGDDIRSHQKQQQQHRIRRLRPSSRGPTTLRPLAAELSPLSRSDGSASLRVGNTHVLCAVHGPTMPRNARHERCDRGVVSVAFSRGLLASSSGGGVGVGDGGGGGGGASGADATADDAAAATIKTTTALPMPPGLGATERELERFVRDSLSSCILLENYPRCVIQVIVQVVQADGSVLGGALNCAVLALLDAGIAMAGVPVATTCVVFGGNVVAVDGDGDGTAADADGATCWLDPDAEEESGDGRGIAVVVTDAAASSSYASSSSEYDDDDDDAGVVIAMHTFGSPVRLGCLLSAVDHSRRYSAPAMAAFVRLAIERKVQREVSTLWS